MTSSPRPVHLLVVCAANICRSPAGAALLTRCFDGSPGLIEVRSAGVRADAGNGGCETIDALLRDRGRLTVDLHEHRSAELTPADLQWADLVLTAERSHRAEIILMDPTKRAHTFTLNEAARLSGPAVERLPPPVDGRHDLHEVIAAMNDLRGELLVDGPRIRRSWLSWRRRPVLTMHPDDIVDSHAGGGPRHHTTVEALLAAVDQLDRSFGYGLPLRPDSEHEPDSRSAQHT